MNTQSKPQIQKLLSTMFGALAVLAQVGCADLEEDLELRDQDIEAIDEPVAEAGIAVGDFPYLNQNHIPEIGWAACSSACAAMVLAYDGKIPDDKASMIDAAVTVFWATANLQVGLLDSTHYINHLKQHWGYTNVEWYDSDQETLFDLMLAQLKLGRPVILGTKGSINPAGHYVVVLGVDGLNYKTANIIIDDPYGDWVSYNKWIKGDTAGKGVKQRFTTFTSAKAAGIFILTP
jgi:hypothetical protein